MIDVDNRTAWRNIGMALKSEFASGRSLWDEWARRSTKYDENDQEKNWN